MSVIADIRAGLANNLRSIKGVQVSAYILSNPTLPTLWVRPAPEGFVSYHQSMGGVEEWRFHVQAYFGISSDIGAQKALDQLLASTGPTSVKAAIESDPTLGGIVAQAVVEDCLGYQEYARPDGASAFGAEWRVRVITNPL